MALRRSESWITAVVDDNEVASAMVLAQSLRRTKTTRLISVVTTKDVSRENRSALQAVFDMTFCQEDDEKHFPPHVYAFSLVVFEKCVFLAPNHLVLENIDSVFDDSENYKLLENPVKTKTECSFFKFEPCRALWNHLKKNPNLNGNLKAVLEKWMANQGNKLSVGNIPATLIAKFETDSGVLEDSEIGQARVIQLTRMENLKKLPGQMELLSQKQLGLFEKLIVSAWLDLYEIAVVKELQGLNKGDVTNDDIPIYKSEPIAIIGMSCRYPGANSVQEFWNMLYEGEEGVREPPAFRWTKEHSLRVSAQERKTNAGFLSTTVDEFDARFFGVSPKEAVYLDPQTRLLHEVLWESLEDAGIDPLSLYGSHAGIFTGSWMNDYKDIVQNSSEKDFFRTYMGNSIGAAAARLSFLLGLTGPSIATESGCSSAIVALDLAIKSLRNGESNLAMAGGVNLLLHPFTSGIMDYVIAPDGRCKTFDAKADGFGRAEGCGVLVLKRLTDALRDRDNMWAIIRGSGVSQEGLSRSLGTPTTHCEALAMQLALKDAGVRPEQVSFVETHGTGTSVGDPMEISAIAKAYYSAGRSSALIIGSVKTNVGHTESCSGITGIMKAVLALQHELIPKHRNLENLNPEIFLDSIPAMIPLEPIAWPKKKGKPRLAGISSFGITGTDGHVIIEEAPCYQLPKITFGLERPLHLLKISAKTSEALDELLNRFEKAFLEEADQSKPNLFADAAFTANVGRASFNHRAFLVANNFGNASKMITEKQYCSSEVTGDDRQLCFLFTGQGSQYSGMAKLLYETSPVFQMHFDSCDRVLRDNYDISLRSVLWESDSSSNQLSRTIFSQTSIFCIEYCLLKLWQSWGIQPDYVLGHSLGEFCAAVAADILDFSDALKLVAERSRLIDALPQGSMLVVKANVQQVQTLMQSAKVDLDLAAINSPEQTVVAGNTETVHTFLEHLNRRDVKAIVLDATHAFHSRHMDAMLEDYRKVAETVKYKKGNGDTQYVSGMEGRILDDLCEINADYWVRHTHERVSFVDACAALRGVDFLEVGPQPILSSFVLMNSEGSNLSCLPSIRKNANDWQTILTSLGKLYLLGYPVNWKGFDIPYPRNKISLPFHPFHRKSFWVEPQSNNVTMIHPLLGHQLNNASALKIFENDLKPRSVPYLQDHCVGSRMVFPGAAFTEMCLSAGYCVANGLSESLEFPRRPMALENMQIDAPLELKEGKSCRLQVIVDLPEKDTVFRIKVYHQNVSSEESGKWVLHATSSFVPVPSTKNVLSKWNVSRIEEIMTAGERQSVETFYKRADEVGLKFGETFQMAKKLWLLKQPNCTNTDEVVFEMEMPVDQVKYIVHPLILDATFQTVICCQDRYERSKLKVPVHIGRVTVFSGIEIHEQDESNKLLLYSWLDNGKYSVFVSQKSAEKPLLLLEDIELIETTARTIESVLEQQSSLLPDAWEEQWKVIPSPLSSSVKPVEIQQILASPALLEKVEHLRKTPPEDVVVFAQINRIIYLYILNTLYDLGWKPNLHQTLDVSGICREFSLKPEFRHILSFYLRVLEEDGHILKKKSEESWEVCKMPEERNKVTDEILRLNNILKISCKLAGIYENIAINLVKILQGECSALELLFPTDESQSSYSADAYYDQSPALNQIMDVIGEICTATLEESRKVNDSDQKIYRILEVGAGTGSLTKNVLHRFKDIFGNCFEYYYTDISQSFFIKGEKKFEEYRDNIKFAIFNVEQSPLSQGLYAQFDMVLCAEVLHATRDLEESLVHLRQTLRPGGVLVFSETIIPARDITFVFGLLPGYWRFEDFHRRPNHCCISDKAWEQLLNQTGFYGVRSFRVWNDQFGIIMAAADPEIKIQKLEPPRTITRENRDRWVIFADGDDFEVTAKIANIFDVSGRYVELVFRADRQPSHKQMQLLNDNVTQRTIWADSDDPLEMDSVLKHEKDLKGIIYAWGMNMQEREQRNIALPFLHIAKMISAERKPPLLYILTRGVHAINEDSLTCHPSAATLFGMAKSLVNEQVEAFVRYVDFDQSSNPETLASQLLYEATMNQTSKEKQRVQVVYRDNLRYEPRFTKISIPAGRDELKLPPSTDRYKLLLPKSRLINDLSFDVLEEQDIGENEVELAIKAYALNFRDIFAILKPSAQFEHLNAVGLDFSAVVTKSGAKSKFKRGQRVFGAHFQHAQLPSHLVLDSQAVLEIPEKMTFWEAATLPAVFSTAYHCLVTVANLKKGETVLIHTGSGGVGLAAIQVASNMGANIITTAGNSKKRGYLRGLGIKHVFHSRDTSYESKILEVTNGKGVDVVLNSITGPGFKEATLNATAKHGRFVEMSKLSVWTVDEVKILRPDVDYRIVDLTILEQDAWSKLLETMQVWLDEGSLKAIPYVKFDALNIRQALQYLQKAKHIGKVVVTMPEVSQIEGEWKVNVPLFNGESTYLITGGLGGIGFEVCKWMLEHGATDIVLNGRSPPTQEAAEQIKTLNGTGFHVAVKLGDVSDFNQCKAIIDEINSHGKPLRGIMHCAGVLRDNLYENQKWEGFEATFSPKVSGTWNLHKLTANLPLEHFVTYSSVTALIGTPVQATHTAANCFEDAFTHYRHSLGLPATTINWGQWSQVGCAKEVNVTGVLPVSVKRMLNGLEYTMKTNKRQSCYSVFDSLTNLAILCPKIKSYLDERIWKQVTTTSSSKSSNAQQAEQFWKEMDAVATKQEKVNILSGYLKVILQTSLRLDPDEVIKDDANVQELGVDSLMMLELKNSIQLLLGSRVMVTANTLKNCNTVCLIANAVIDKLFDEEGVDEDARVEPLSPQELLDALSKDSVLDSQIQASSPAGKSSKIKTILLTGATGQLGTHILAEILKSYTCIERVVCLVHASPIPKESLKLSPKVECVSGDVTQENLGISLDQYNYLSESVDAVIHCAAKQSYSEHYIVHDSKHKLDIRTVNVVGTVNILRFAAVGKTKHVYYPSSAICGILGSDLNNSLLDEWPTQELIQTLVSSKFPALQITRFVAEMLLRQANERGIPCKVFRFPWIAGDSNTGQVNYLNNMNIFRFLCFLKVGAMSDLPMPANMMPVDLCTDYSLKLFMSDETPYEVFNVVHPVSQVEQEFVQMAKEEFGKELEILDKTEFEARLQTMGKSQQLVELDLSWNTDYMINYFVEGMGIFKGYLESPDTYFKSPKVCRFIPNFGKDLEPSMEMLRRDLKYLRESGILEKFLA